MIYATTIEVDAAPFGHGGWLYIDLAEGSSFRDQQQADDDFLKKYAARIPPLKPNESRSLFAPILFPVLFKKNAGDPDPVPDGTFDQLLIETAEYDDGFAKIVPRAPTAEPQPARGNARGRQAVKDCRNPTRLG